MGRGNTASVRQTKSQANLRQEGDDNTAKLLQAGSFSGGTAAVVQSGDFNVLDLALYDDINSAVFSQLGSGNAMTVVQIADLNALSLEQAGDNLELKVTQMGGATASIVQSGVGP